MKTLFTIILLASFVGIAVFGFAGMHRGDMQGHDGGCVAATAQGTDCPIQSNSIFHLTFHLGAFKNFSIATVSNVAVSLLIFALFAFGIAWGVLLRNLAPPKLNFAYHRRSRSDSLNSSSERALVHWLAFHQNSPAIP